MNNYNNAAYEVANKLMEYLKQNGWNSTLPLIREIQQKESDSAKNALEIFESRIANCDNPEFIISYAREIKGANLQQLLHGLISIQDDCEPYFKADKKLYHQTRSYIEEILELIKAQKTVSSSDIRNLIDNL